MALFRQHGAPTLFCTLSSAEFDWNELAQQIYQTKTRKKVSLAFIKSQTQAWKNKLISENVVQSTIHFSKRTDKIMSILSNLELFQHNDIMYKTSSYFFRVEFQARGAPHIHCMLWLKGENGEVPPTLYSDEDSREENLKSIASFGSSIISSSSQDVCCDVHSNFTDKCDNCNKLKQDVEHYQTHSHKHSCLKRKMIRILENEGHGRLDGKRKDDELLVTACRYNFPKNPIDRTEMILGFSKDHDKKEVKSAKEDYAKIRKYLLRITHGENFKETEKWSNFIQMDFYEFLYEVGMFKDGEDTNDEDAKLRARARYLVALKCEVKSTGLLLLKRNTYDVFTNNYNKKLIQIHQANQDVQYITDEYAVAEYISDYCTKLESGQTALLKSINEEATASGESNKDTIKKLAKALDKGRECGIQESVYRTLGLCMTKFSEIVKFINTNHPYQRDGLLKANLDELPQGEPIFHNSIHEYYQDRPKNSDNDDTDWESMTLAEFIANYTIYKSKPSTVNAIKLLNKRGYITKRGKECVIRYYLRYENEIDYYRALCILFLPFRNEMRDIHAKDPQLLYKENESAIELIRSHFEKHKKLVEAIQEVEDKKQDHEDDDEDDENGNFIDDETTTEDELRDFNNFVKNQARNQIRQYNEGKEKMKDDDYKKLVKSLNNQQRKIFDDFVERIIDPEELDPFYLYIGGEAGTGKSFLLKLMIEAVNKLPNYSGQSLDKPFSITIAPTGCAAYIVNGSTIESALGIQPQKRKSYVSANASRNSNLRFLYEDLKVP